MVLSEGEGGGETETERKRGTIKKFMTTKDGYYVLLIDTGIDSIGRVKKYIDSEIANSLSKKHGIFSPNDIGITLMHNVRDLPIIYKEKGDFITELEVLNN